MTSPGTESRIAEIYRQESRRVLATLIRLLGEFDLAEEGVQEAFTAAATQWPQEGIPDNPRAWLISTGRFKAIDRIRRRAKFDRALSDLVVQLEHDDGNADEVDDESLEDDRLRLIFICCHPALSPDARVAMTLREVCGLTTEEIARAFLTSPSTVAQRIVRAKAKIRAESIPYSVPAEDELAARIEVVLRVVYLVFNEGYSPSSGEMATRPELIDEAVRLGRILVELVPDPEALGLLSLMLFHDSRRMARSTASGDLILLSDQDRSSWDEDKIAEGSSLLERAWESRDVGPYALQAAIAATHACAPNGAETNWERVVELYDMLMLADGSPVVELNRAVAVAMRDGPSGGLALIDEILARGDLGDYHPAHAARADLLRRLGRHDDARDSYSRALEAAEPGAQRRFLEKRLAENLAMTVTSSPNLSPNDE
jgi:RNA polymerase sigma-70 factor, ECF subfamily